MADNIEQIKHRYQISYMIRQFERKVENEFEKGTMRGTTHGCIGQEIIPIVVMELIDKETDYVVGTHRCHGQILAYTGDPYKLICEMTGKKDGFVQGMGGSQHIRVGKYITNGITGGMATIGCGIALGLKKDNSNGIVVAFMGDGGFNEGYVQESLNLASVMELPIIFVCENNHYAMSTPTERFSAGSFQRRVEAVDIHYIGLTTDNIDTLSKGIRDGFEYVRDKRMPCFLEIKTARLCGHSKSDKREYISDKDKQLYADNDPLKALARKLQTDIVESINQEVEKQLENAFIKARKCKEINIGGLQK